MKKFSQLFEGSGMPASASAEERHDKHLADIHEHLKQLQAHLKSMSKHKKDHRSADHLHHLSHELSKLVGHADHHEVLWRH
jgi:hypothetical protein